MQDRKVICFILPSFFFERKGGSELQVLYIAIELIARGWEVHYIRENDKKIGMTENFNGIILHAIHRKKEYMKWRNYAQLKLLMEKIKADYWYCRSTYIYLESIIKISKKIGGKTIWACSHDTQLDDHIIKTKKNQYYKIPFLCLFGLFKKNRFRKILKSVDHIILQNSYQHFMLKKNYNKIGHIIFNAHPIPDFKDTIREPIILWIGRLQNWKRPEIALEYAEKFRSKNFKFIMIGRLMNNQIQKMIIDASERLTNFEYIGEVELDQVNKMLSKSKLLLCTSYHEGFPNTFVQAWLRGVPIVSTKVDPNNFIRIHRLGKVSSDFDKLYYYINKIMTDHLMWLRVSHRCRNFSKSIFNIKTHVDKVERILRKT